MWAARNWGAHFDLEGERLMKYGIHIEHREELQFYDLGGRKEVQVMFREF